jgi:branched-chain amino acid transport system substrate-binding protein
VRRRASFGLLAPAVAVLALVAAGCGGDDGGAEVTALPSASCSSIFYEGDGEPDALIASDLPLQGAGRAQTVQMTDAIKFVLRQRDFKAGDLNIGYQSCDDATAQAGSWDSAKCTANARAYANNEAVVGVIGTFNSGCAKLVIPVLNRASNGPVAMISPANTYPGLTQGGPGTVKGEPNTYYPTGQRNYIRMVAADDFQGAADGLFVKQQNFKKVFVLNDKETYGFGVAALFREALQKLEIPVAGFQAWDKKATSYESLAERIKATGADAVFLGGIVCNNGAKLIKDLRAGLGPDVTLIGPDGFTPFSAVADAGDAAEGMYISVAGQPNDKLGPTGNQFVQDFRAESGKAPDPYAVYAAQAAITMLDSIERAGEDVLDDRGKVSEELFKTKYDDSILGKFEIDRQGDTSFNPITIYQMKGGDGATFTTITPDAIRKEGVLRPLIAPES